MHNNQQYEQLMLQYEQLKNGANDIFQMLKDEDYDSALTMIKSREAIFLNCKCMNKYLELTPEQKNNVSLIMEEIRQLEARNIEFLKENYDSVKHELKKTQKTEKIQLAYDFDESNKGSIVNIQE